MLSSGQDRLYMRVLPDLLRYDDVPTFTLFLHPRGEVHGSAEIIQYVIHIDSDAWAMMNADL